MSFSQLVGTVKKQGVEYTMVRPGITICLWYAQPAHVLAPAVAGILEKYLAFISPQTLSTYLSAGGVWKPMTPKVLQSILKEMRTVGTDEYAETHLGQEPVRNVGRFGAHFQAGPLNDPSFPDAANMLVLEFPDDLLETVPAERFIGFLREVAEAAPFDSGYAGYAFKHLFMSLLSEAYEHIGQRAMRYTGFDISSDLFKLDARHHVCNVSWLTLFGKEIVAALGGEARIRAALQGMAIERIGDGLMVLAADRPIVGDVNRGATDAAPLRMLAALTRELRPEVDSLGPEDDEFAEQWMTRFDRA